MSTLFELRTDYHCPTGILESVAPGLRRITANNSGPLTFRGTGTYVVGEQQVAVIDPGPNDPSHLDALMDALGSETVSHILVTHTHRDHSDGADSLKRRCGAPTYSMGRHTALQRASPLPAELDSAGDTEFAPDIILKNNDTIAGRTWALQCIHTPGHASNHAAFAQSAYERVFVGDLVMGWSTPVLMPPDGHLGDYLASLQKLQTRPETTYWPTHGAPIEQPQNLLAFLIKHRHQRVTSVLDAIIRGHQTLDAIVADAYPGLDSALQPAAIRSTLASVVYLIEHNKLSGDLALGLDIILSPILPPTLPPT